eukprot:3311468-Lingulodinium_polyedra.AAC.1
MNLGVWWFAQHELAGDLAKGFGDRWKLAVVISKASTQLALRNARNNPKMHRQFAFSSGLPFQRP